MGPLVSMNSEGRLTVPAAVRRHLGLDGETQFQYEVREGALVLRPASVVPREDAWAYTPAHRERLRAALADSREGRVRQLREDELDRRGA